MPQPFDVTVTDANTQLHCSEILGPVVSVGCALWTRDGDDVRIYGGTRYWSITRARMFSSHFYWAPELLRPSVKLNHLFLVPSLRIPETLPPCPTLWLYASQCNTSICTIWQCFILLAVFPFFNFSPHSSHLLADLANNTYVLLIATIPVFRYL